MISRFYSLGVAVLCFIAGAGFSLAKPTVFLVGDSTVRVSTPGQQGWGDSLMPMFDAAKVEVENRAIGGRSSRTFLTEGRWDAVMARLKKGDYVIMQLGHNDSGKLNDERCRATLKGTGDETETITRVTDGQEETVHSYGWYLTKYVSEAKAKGAIPIVLSPIPRNTWKDGKCQSDGGSYSKWAEEVARNEGAFFVPFQDLLVAAYTELGEAKTTEIFAEGDHTHTAKAGAEFNAKVLAKALRGLEGCDVASLLIPDSLWLPNVFSSHMVLQRDAGIAVWGRAAAKAKVDVRFKDEAASTTADENGKWQLTLPQCEAGGPFTLAVASDGAELKYDDVWVGEVWLCSGQSNMDFTMAETEKRYFAGVADWPNEVAKADEPAIRMFSAEWSMQQFPQENVGGAWQVCSPETVGDFSAVAYYYAKALHDELQVPIGLVTSAYGGSTIEAWMRDEVLRENTDFKPLLQSFDDRMLKFRDDPKSYEDYGKALTSGKKDRNVRNPDPVKDQHNPSVLANGMIAPLVPYTVRGMIWYQGESNQNTRKLYTALQNAFIGDMRKQWGKPEMPFYFTQLAAYQAPVEAPSNSQLAEMRAAQAASLSLPNTGMAVTIDIGDAKDVHPRNKKDVGARLARLALCKTYDKGGVCGSPLMHEATCTKDGKVRVEFDHTGSGLETHGDTLRHFALAGEDGRFVWADATLDPSGSSVTVSSPQVSSPRAVRYAWANNPEGANLYNKEGFPAAPFEATLSMSVSER